MNDICFDINSLRLVPEACLHAEKGIRQSLGGLGEVTRKLEEELSSFTEYGKRAMGRIRAHMSEIGALMGTVDQRIAAAQSKKQRELPPPLKPSVPSDATPARRDEMESAYSERARAVEEQNARIRLENQRIDEYCTRCNGTKRELEELIAALRQLEESLRREIGATASVAHEHIGKAHGEMDQSGRINGAMSTFSGVFVQVLEDAQQLCLMNASPVRGYSYVDRLFVIRNTHSHRTVPSGVIFGSLSERDAVPEATGDRLPDENAEILIRTKDRDAFLAAAQNAKRIRMPSANLHRLGGSAFMADMNALGFHTVEQADGSLIDPDGMIHWEK